MLPQGPLYQRSVRLKIKLLLKPFYILESTISLQNVLPKRHGEHQVDVTHKKLATLKTMLAGVSKSEGMRFVVAAKKLGDQQMRTLRDCVKDIFSKFQSLKVASGRI